MTPIGSSAGAIATLAIISVKTKKVPPKKNENGIIDNWAHYNQESITKLYNGFKQCFN